MDAPPPDGRPRPSLRLLPTGGEAKVNQPIPFGTGRPADTGRDDLTDVMQQVAQGDKQAFSALYDGLAPLVFGIVLKVVRDRAQSEEVAQEVMIDLWRQAARYRPEAGSVRTWAATIAHRRAVDRVRSAQAATDREHAQAAREHTTAFDEVAEQVETRLESEQVRRCLRGLTEVQRQAVTLAYYQGLTYREVAEALRTPLPTIKTRMRDGLIRLRDCMGVTT
ncbi:RNA polymerase sigma-70 factor [Streptomyces venezuelae ATCC 10712]|uniref:RNA polymerase sigma-70 factor n=1 Tax=Streptomyces venezuelae (strain ATCC 10712 / CBS 650.69 / DSM 40230 / JCM 4526 / NBRC 13096 / PD 04745) TaxID=953739 RepID=F2R6Z4_STRVP|nr:RNA polymerase sigma-70 factor [Streptomyces venezuelae ATCC 10712]